MPDLFISYAREDRDTALALARALQSRGIDVWWDRELTGGGDFAAEIERNLKAAPVAVVLWSAASVRSDFVRDESSRARDLGKLLPVRIADVQLPLGFGTLHTLDLLDWDGDATDDACAALINQVLQRLAAAGPRDGRTDEAQRLANLAQLASEDTLSHRRSRRRLLLAAGAAGVAGVGTLGWIGWTRVNRREALDHLSAGLEDHFATPPRLESAQSQYTSALELDDSLAPAHYYLGHLYAQLMLRGSPPPAGEVLDALREDARFHFQSALDWEDGLDSVQRVVARSQLSLLTMADAAPPLTRPAEVASVGTGAASPSITPPPPPSSGSAASEPSRPRAPRVSAEPAVAQAALSRSEALFSADRDTRLAAGTSLTLDPAGAAESLPSAIAEARRALRSAPGAESTAQGVASTLALLERASPATLRAQQESLQAFLGELADSPLGAAQRDRAASLSAALQRSGARQPVAYLQIARESQRPLAQALARRLSAAGYVTPGIELTGEARAPDRPSLRVQGASDPELARWCQRALAEAVGAPVELVALRRATPGTDTYELWFDKSLCAPGGRQANGCAA
ncbi:TIR domain-containing protein [Ideonella sp. YS5]|uniref:TIR domain-containing protein n=1 Tax=Ideonella sp. YS5 TaxID=3453714 RepID=UPI003EEF4492